MLAPEPQAQPTATPPAAEAVLTVEHLYKSFGDNHVLQDFSLTLHRGENVVVLGKSGSGKSVLIKCIIGLLRAEAGRIVVLGQDVATLDHEAMDRLRAKVGFLFQSNALYDSMTVRENLLFPLRRHWLDHPRAQEGELVMQALEDVSLAHTADMMPAELSGGMRKRIALARTLILRPDIILYDEPTTGLDPVTAREIDHLIREVQHKYGTTALIISHDMSCVRLTADRVALLVEGRCYAEGPYDELSHRDDPKIREFFA
ncbi:phospholipid/cholesterol/gamma-HCH transport system ATP-binding protein [Hymenobacter daecheongensis DSM 21074]|uniref:Phospholipid/cholesterol/gamma-HCH transport system ATP-binding protein n=1 Tax=Hymenobacter daecheongensis DSM 21074 TaxID=1121955 RepID=A0A1M6MDA4_9BACT|nr:ATP-binding cassette domain-containing protein [Hymenobacter daecheongensis]SHJ81417.1 phospholipid/cholesterol/gamma-HCH transport system ATP-binding protein [Hymenobacter daecheongensis DSM 21074]